MLETIEERVKRAIADAFNIEIGDIKSSQKLADDLGADSLSRVELIMYLEEDFGIEIPDEVAEKLETVQGIIDYVKKEKE